MIVSIKVTGTKELARALRSMSDEVREKVGQATQATALELRAEVIKSIQRGPKSGVTYQKYNPRRSHKASAPGQAPATDLGRLVGSIRYEKASQMRATVGAYAVYAAYLEFGTRKMAARPFMRPAAEKVRASFERRIRKAVAEAVQ